MFRKTVVALALAGAATAVLPAVATAADAPSDVSVMGVKTWAGPYDTPKKCKTAQDSARYSGHRIYNTCGYHQFGPPGASRGPGFYFSYEG